MNVYKIVSMSSGYVSSFNINAKNILDAISDFEEKYSTPIEYIIKIELIGPMAN